MKDADDVGDEFDMNKDCAIWTVDIKNRLIKRGDKVWKIK
jgi:hypothetical protein